MPQIIIKDVRMEEFGRKMWTDRNGVVETTDGRRWVYSLEYNNRTWKDKADYLDNVKSDFLNEAKFGIDDTELFYKYEEFYDTE